MNVTLKSVMVIAFTVGTMDSMVAHADPGFRGHGPGHAHNGRGPRHLTAPQRMALRLTMQTHDLLDEVNLHFNDKARYQHFAEDAVELNELANHVRMLVNRDSSGRHIRRDIAQMGELADHLDDLIHQMQRRADRPQQITFVFGHGVRFDSGRREREGLAHLHEQVDMIRTTLAVMDREMDHYRAGVDRVLDQHAPANRSAVEVRPVFISPRSTGLNLNVRFR
ncbi:MAG: hypothetical protein O2955_03950 [Planctomycetota bacterium]|nr:hypothetical protein [Planctomycetota bacterium]MDA1211642.1 hypothetical protein [Planctomycetota bacterium]